jgi:hypothetical protein
MKATLPIGIGFWNGEQLEFTELLSAEFVLQTRCIAIESKCRLSNVPNQ